MDEQAVERLVVRKIFGQPQFSNYRVTPESFEAYQDELDDLPITYEQGWAAVRSMLYENDRALPTPQGIRRRVMAELGLLAPTWPDAMLMIEAEAAGAASLRSLPGPVAAALKANGGFFEHRRTENPTTWRAQVRATYQRLAEEHDRLVLEPGGLHRFAEVCRWFEALQAHEELYLRAREAALLLPPPPLGPERMPAPWSTDQELQAFIDEAEIMVGPIDEIGKNDPPRPRPELRDLLRRIGRGWGG